MANQRQTVLWELAELNDTLARILKRYCVQPTATDRDDIFRLREKRAKLETKLGLLINV
jgi:hypothetical protein